MRALKPLLTGLCLAAMTSASHAQVPNWLMQISPGSLGLYVWVSEDCSFSEDDVLQRVSGEFRKAKIKPTNSLELNLTLNIDCLRIENNDNERLGTAMYIETRFGTQLNDGSNVLYEAPNYGKFLVASSDERKNYFLNEIQKSAGSAIKDYVRANR